MYSITGLQCFCFSGPGKPHREAAKLSRYSDTDTCPAQLTACCFAICIITWAPCYCIRSISWKLLWYLIWNCLVAVRYFGLPRSLDKHQLVYVQPLLEKSQSNWRFHRWEHPVCCCAMSLLDPSVSILDCKNFYGSRQDSSRDFPVSWQIFATNQRVAQNWQIMFAFVQHLFFKACK